MMKTKLFLAVVAATMFVACDRKGYMEADHRLMTDSVKFEQKDTVAEIRLKADFPVRGQKALTNAIAEYISEQWGGTYTGALTGGDSIANYYGQAQKDSLTKMRAEFGTTGMPFFYSSEVNRVAETGKYVSYTTYTETFLGGAHGDHSLTGVTFRIADGRRFGWEMLRNTDAEAFRAFIREGLTEYFSKNTAQPVKTDADLKGMLLVDDDVNYLPLPKAAPYLTQDGVAFVYQIYEIAPYAAGMPTFVVPFSKIRPYLTATVTEMLETEK